MEMQPGTETQPGAETSPTHTAIISEPVLPVNTARDTSSFITRPKKPKIIPPTAPITRENAAGSSSAGIPSKKQLKKMTSIEQAKDRAQVTAATSMSIVHVALLKAVIDVGEELNPFYNWSLGLIITALILQIISGLISLYIALLRFYFTEYKDDFLDDCVKTCCPFTCRKRKGIDLDNSFENWINVSSKDAVESEDKDKSNCCRIDCTTISYADYEYHILDMYDNMVEENIKADLYLSNYDVEKAWLTQRERDLTSELERINGITEKSTEEQQQLESIKEELLELNERQYDLEKGKKNSKSKKAQGEVLEKHVERIQEERVLKRTTFWQNWLNMMMYIVFVLNALIAGLGLSNLEVNGLSNLVSGSASSTVSPQISVTNV